jgi:hypothetical protein
MNYTHSDLDEPQGNYDVSFFKKILKYFIWSDFIYITLLKWQKSRRWRQD